MLDKYEHFKKVSRTEGCSFYDAQDRTTMQNVLMKRLQQKCTWDQLLNNRNLQFLSKAKFAPKMVQIFKKKNYYFIVFQKPTGLPLSQPSLIGKYSPNKFYPLFLDLIEGCIKIKEQVPHMYILPQWVFTHRNSCRIAHFQPFIGEQAQEGGGSKHVFMYNLQKSMMVSSTKQMNDSDILSFEKKQSLIFNLGAIAYQLITGLKATDADTQEQYKQQLMTLQLNCEKRIIKQTGDQKLGQMISKMVKQDPFDSPNLTQLYNLIKRKNKMYEPKNNNNPTLQLQLEKIKLTDKFREVNKKKFKRPCCKTMQNQQVEVQIEKKGSLTVAAYMRKSYHTRNRSFLPEITSNRLKYKSKQTKVSKPIMLRSQGDLRLKDI